MDNTDLPICLRAAIHKAAKETCSEYALGSRDYIPANDYDIEPQSEAFANVITSAITNALIEKALNASQGAARPMHTRHPTTQ
jgi:hypothetical protein